MARANKSETQIERARRAVQSSRYAQAGEICRALLNRTPYNTAALSTLSSALLGMGRQDEALQAAEQAVRLAPLEVEPHLRQGLAASRSGETVRGRKILEEALRIKPRTRADLVSRGQVFAALGNHTEAIACYVAALSSEPGDVCTLRQLESAARSVGVLEEAWQATQAALKDRPEEPEVLDIAARLLISRGRVTEALSFHRRSLAVDEGKNSDYSAYLLALNYDPDVSSETLQLEHVQWAERRTAGLMTAGDQAANERSASRRLRIGYVSADLYRHPVSQFVRGLLAEHDPAAFEVYVYSDTRREDAVTAALRKLVPQWRKVNGLDDAALAAQIRQDQIDILVDLSGHTSVSRLLMFARKPAPVQVTYLGYCATTGLPAMDYCLTDSFLDPPGAEHGYTEKLVRLPECFCCFWPPRDPQENALDPTMSGELPVNELPALANGFITFGSFHALRKLNDAVLDLWAEVLRAIPESRLFLYRNTLHGVEQVQLQERLAARGIAPERVRMEYTWPIGHHYLTRYHEIDIHLDTFPWSGHTTTCEALWMGIPTLTLLGERHASRLSGTVLRAVGLDEFTAQTGAEYVAKARDWARRLAELAALRAGLRERVANSRLCDARTFTRELEEAYRQLWQDWCVPRPS